MRQSSSANNAWPSFAELEARIAAIVRLAKDCYDSTLKDGGPGQWFSPDPKAIIEYAEGGRGPYRPEDSDEQTD